MDRDSFFARYNIKPDDFAKTGIGWAEIEKTIAEYDRIKPALESVGRYVVDALLKCNKVHSIKYRLKENEHLAEKIIRKCAGDPDRRVDSSNFRNEITDLVGIRALHLFKEEWIHVHEYICDTWSLSGKPIAYVRAGDSEELLKYYKDNNCEVKEHRFGYRSVHYIIESQPDREKYVVEIQARTVFEEAWGEIDHVISYPYETGNELLVRLSMILNRLAANADELGSYMRYLKTKTDFTEQQYRRTIREKNAIIEDLRSKIEELQIDGEQKKALTSGLNELRKNRSHEADFADRFPWLDHFMESDLFKDITERISAIVNSDKFQEIELSDGDLQMLSNAQRDLMRLMGSPEAVAQVLKKQQLLHNLPEPEKE
ncbi:MAG TPA: RelA/SpoT domain-containing protein [Spirochaetia bacterium]|nr:RelA/SpoT domain-containing protein [Spirochaetia bacterium]